MSPESTFRLNTFSNKTVNNADPYQKYETTLKV